MEKIFCYIVALCIYSIQQSNSASVPVMLWTNKQNLRYPMLISGKSLSGKEFGDGYLEQIVQNGDQNFAVFIQDQLSLSDITNYADVFNEESNGDVFSSLKTIMENYESTHIASVSSPTNELKKLQRKFEGKIHAIENPDDLNNLDLADETPNMVLINLPSDDKDRKNSLKNSDDIIGKITEKLSKQKRSFSALYTGSEASELSEAHAIRGGRHLLQASDAASGNSSTDYTFFNITTGAAGNETSCLFIYYAQFMFQVVQIGLSTGPNYDNHTQYPFPVLKSDTKAIVTESTCNLANQTASVNFDFKSSLPEGLTTFKMSMKFSSMAGFWSIIDWQVSFDGHNKTSQDKFAAENWQMANMNNTIYGTLPYGNPTSKGYSYHCGEQKIEQKVYNSTGDLIVRLNITDFQLQFNIRNNSFGPSNECIGFFSGAIWMTIIFFILMISILSCGMGLLASIQTMDRFDDPKGKTIQVNTSD